MKIWPSVAAFGLFALAVAAAAPAPTPSRSNHAELDRLTPRDAEMVVQINVRQMLQSALVKKHALDPLKLLLQRNDEVRQLLRAAGLDPLKDIDTIGLSTSGNPMMGGKLVAVMRGDFAPDKARMAIEEYMKKHPGHLKSVKDGDLAMWEILDDNKSFYAAFAGDKTLVLTASKEDTAALVRRAGQTPPPPSAAMRSALEHLKGSESLWLAMVATDEVKQLLKADDTTKEFASALQSVTGTLEVSDDARFGLVVHTNSPDAATKIKGKLDELMPLLTFLGAGKDSGGRIAKEIVSNIKLNAEKNDVSLRIQITEDQIEKARKKDR